jgi:hypothetical protein
LPVADNPREAAYKRIAAFIRKAGPKGITHGKLTDKLKSIDARQREEILKDLHATGDVVTIETPTKGRPTRRLVWFEITPVSSDAKLVAA